MTTTLDFEMARTHVRFRCGFAPLMEYAKAHFAPVLGEMRRHAAVEVDADLHWHEGHPPADAARAYPEVRGCERLDRDLWAGPGAVVWLRVDDMRDLHLRFRWDGATLAIRGDYYHRLSTNRRADSIRRIVYRRQISSFRRKRFTRLLYYLVYYPLFWRLEHERGAHPLHAAAVATASGGVLLAGPSGVGKSTLTTALGACEGAKILSDTFVAQRGRELWAIPEPLLLDAWSMQWLGEASSALTGVPHEYALGRDGYAIPRSRFTDRCEAAVIVLPRRAPEHFIRPVSAADAAARIDAYDDIVNDLRRYRPLAAVLELMAPKGLGGARLRSLAELTSAVPCYELGLTQTLTRAEAVSALLALCNGREQSTSATAVRRRS